LQVWYLICSYVGRGGFTGLVILTSPYSSELLVPSRGGGVSASRVFLCVHRLGTFGFLCASLYLEHVRGMEVWFYPFLTSTLDSGVRSTFTLSEICL